MNRRVGRYRLIRWVGQGASGTVHEAEQTGPGGLKRTVALKVLHRGAASLWHEARLGGLLRHPHLVDVYEVGEADGEAFCAMEWCEGGALSAWAPLPPQAVLDAGIQACAALSYAHEQLGLVHLDVKPDNLMLSRDGVKVGDWGIARVQGVGPVQGTIGFMAPEQRRGEPVDTRTDVYALGVTLARLATGGTDDEAFTIVPSADALPTIDLSGDRATVTLVDRDIVVPDWLREVVVRCVHPDPAERWPSMAALAQALGEVEAQGPGLRQLISTQGGVAPDATPVVALHGREEVLERTCQLTRHSPELITLKGPPGVGKSQLARAVAARWTEAGAAVVWCDVDGVSTVEELLQLLARELGASLADTDLGAQLLHLGRILGAMGGVLMVFDNVSSDLPDPTALAKWTPGNSGVHWLATSRQPLRVPGEMVVDVEPLALEACRRVFWAAAHRRGVAETPHSGLDGLLERLDRLPLAIELCAGRLGVLSLDEVVSNTNLSFLRSGQVGRHQTLHGALQMSWQLLEPSERQALQALAAFRGSVDMGVVDAVLDGIGDPLELLDALSRRSLLRANGNRFEVLATVRDFVRDQGEDLPWAEEVHGACLAGFGDKAGLVALRSHGGHQRWLRLSQIHGDARLACERAVRRGDGATATACLRAWWAVSVLRGPFEPATHLAASVLALDSLTPQDRAATLVVHGHAERLLGALDEARDTLTEAIERAARGGFLETGLEAAIAVAPVHAGHGRHDQAYGVLRQWVARGEGKVHGGLLALALAQWGAQRWEDADGRERVLARAVATARASGNRRPEGMAMQVLAALDHMGGRRARAERRYVASLRVLEELGDRRFQAIIGSNLAMLLMSTGRAEEARARLQSVLRASQEMGDRRQEMITWIAIGEAHLYLDEPPAALEAFSTARAHAASMGIPHRAMTATLGQVEAWSRLGDIERCVEALRDAESYAGMDPVDLLLARAGVALARNDRGLAEDLLAQAQARATPMHADQVSRLEIRLASAGKSGHTNTHGGVIK